MAQRRLRYVAACNEPKCHRAIERLIIPPTCSLFTSTAVDYDANTRPTSVLHSWSVCCLMNEYLVMVRRLLLKTTDYHVTSLAAKIAFVWKILLGPVAVISLSSSTISWNAIDL